MTYFVPPTVASSRYDQRMTLLATSSARQFLRDAAASFEHHAEQAEYAHAADEFRAHAAELRALLA